MTGLVLPRASQYRGISLYCAPILPRSTDHMPRKSPLHVLQLLMLHVTDEKIDVLVFLVIVLVFLVYSYQRIADTLNNEDRPLLLDSAFKCLESLQPLQQ